MQVLPTNFWPTARNYAEAVQCPAVCFEDPALRRMVPAVDRLGMPLVTSGQFAYVFKLNHEGAHGDTLAVRCFRGYLGDRAERYSALDAHLEAHLIGALPRFRYMPRGILVAGRRYPVLVMEWVEGPTLDVYLDEAVGRRDALLHLADEWVRLVAALSEAGVAHGDLQHGNIIVEHGQLRLVDLDGMFVPALEGFKASEVGHQHYQHLARDVSHFSRDTDNFSALVIYLSLVSLAARPELWAEHHDENLLFTRADFADPDASALFPKIEALGEEHARLAAALKLAARSDPSETPRLTELVAAVSKLPAWVNAPADIEVSGRTREVSRAKVLRPEPVTPWPPRNPWRASPHSPQSASVQSIFNSSASAVAAASGQRDPADVRGNTWHYTKSLFGNSYAYIWWIPLHNFILGELWEAFGVTSSLVGMQLTFVLISVLFLCYGFFRAVYEAETATGITAATSTLAGAQAGTTALNNGAPRAFFTTPAPATTPAQFMTQQQQQQHHQQQPLHQQQQQQRQQPAARAASTSARAVVGNRSLAIYHLPDCDWVDKIATRNRVEFDSQSAALDAGFRPCRVCKP